MRWILVFWARFVFGWGAGVAFLSFPTTSTQALTVDFSGVATVWYSTLERTGPQLFTGLFTGLVTFDLRTVVSGSESFQATGPATALVDLGVLGVFGTFSSGASLLWTGDFRAVIIDVNLDGYHHILIDADPLNLLLPMNGGFVQFGTCPGLNKPCGQIFVENFQVFHSPGPVVGGGLVGLFSVLGLFYICRRSKVEIATPDGWGAEGYMIETRNGQCLVDIIRVSHGPHRWRGWFPAGQVRLKPRSGFRLSNWT